MCSHGRIAKTSHSVNRKVLAWYNRRWTTIYHTKESALFAHKTRYDNRIRTVNTETDDGGSTTDAKTEQKPTVVERTYTQKELDGILARKLADKEAEAAKAKAASETAEQLAQRKYEEGIAKGRVEALRQSVASEYGIDPSILPEDPDKIDEFKKGIDAYVTGHMKVVPSLNKQQANLPTFVTGVLNA